MLSGVKFISRDEINPRKGEDLGNSKKDRKTSSKKEKSSRKKRSLEYGSSDDEGLEKIGKGSRKKKWYSSDDYSASSSEEDGGGGSRGDKSRRKHKGKRRSEGDGSLRKKSKRKQREYSSEGSSSDGSESEEDDRRGRRKGKAKVREDDGLDLSDGPGDSSKVDIVRKEMGLDWMLRPADRPNNNSKPSIEEQPVERLEPPSEEKVNRKELNPYLRDNGTGYPEEEDQTKSKDRLLSTSLVGDGGASWRLKALKRAKEQAAREGKNIKEVVQERWGDLGHLAVSVASRSAAAPRAHLHAIKSRKMGTSEETESESKHHVRRDLEKDTGRGYLKDVSVRHSEMKAPKVHDSLSWGRRKGQNVHKNDAALISSALSSINEFANDGQFMSKFNQQNKAECSSQDAANSSGEDIQADVSNPRGVIIQEAESTLTVKQSSEQKLPLSANQLAAKAMQLRLKGKHEEAEKLLKEAQNTKIDYCGGERFTKLRNDVTSSRYVSEEMKLRQKGKDDDSDIYLAKTIMKNKLYSISGQADDEYDYDGPARKKSRRKGADHENRSDGRQKVAKRIVTQQERCIFCFENPQRPKHLVVAIGNFSYLMLPQFTPVAPGHCCILTLQHELGTRMADDNVWEEIRNFKKCLIMMFAKQDKEVIFLETVMRLAKQQRHCLVECIPLPRDIANEAPSYFKKAIDEAEDEWSQHNAKKLIDTSQKGLRASIPKDFPYFHVEFGLKKGFVHVIDDESQFRTSMGLNVIRGMLQTQDEDMYRRRRYDSIDVQKEAVAAFAKDWDPFDWTKQLD